MSDLNFSKVEVTRFCILLLALQFCSASIALFAQERASLEVGGISWLDCTKGGYGDGPLGRSHGEATFVTNWAVLLGVTVSNNLSFFAETQTINGLDFKLTGLSAIIKPFATPVLGIEAGKFLAPFGNFLRRNWPSENALQTWPLVYNYRTSLGVSSVPLSNRALLLNRGKGQALSYPSLGIFAPPSSSQSPAVSGQGIRLLSRQLYLTGVQLFGSVGPIDYNFGLTNGALSNPANVNANDAIQIIGHLAYRPFTGLELAASASNGAYLDGESLAAQIEAAGAEVEDFHQTAFGADLSFSIGHLQLFAEASRHEFETPFVDENLNADALQLEAVYRIFPRIYLAGRFGQIRFDDIADPDDVDGDGRLREPWDFDVRQVELGAGFNFHRNGTLKLIHVLNDTSSDEDPDDNSWLGQLVVIF